MNEKEETSSAEMNEKEEASCTNSRHLPPLAADMIRNLQARCGMVEWYNPKQLIVTGIKTILSTIFGLYSDYRLLEAYGRGSREYADFSKAFKQNETGATQPINRASTAQMQSVIAKKSGSIT
ncbi:hypothetical protein [Paenibacillus sp. 22594]|uniref:hypothetical protein n=1 Tax=Paenibacillus sp. 22594 TaxID=3453947 RepID=UPI003F879E03